ncbi:hypothetical protein [uncultured Jatrophihabitans sp.]|uniref:LpxL/LpxP family acyltransferase n=1 Tax=uncultured Jatrophihabitans sp. TaxID=1610747 RepID=UPI0035CBB947
MTTSPSTEAAATTTSGVRKAVFRDQLRLFTGIALPPALVPLAATVRTKHAWSNPASRAEHVRQMEYLLGCSERAAEVPALAYGYARYMALRGELRWHPRLITRQRVEGMPVLTGDRDASRGVVLNFMHHGQTDGAWASLRHLGVENLHLMAVKTALLRDAPASWKQRRKICELGAVLVPADLAGTKKTVGLLRRGEIVAIASDLPGDVPVTFLGRRVGAAFGAARLAWMTESPVVQMTAHTGRDGAYMQLHAPLEPRSFPDAKALLQEMLRRFEPAVLAWPEAVELPLSRWTALEPAPADDRA